MTMRKCHGCDTEFEVGPRDRNPRKWCAESCRIKAGRRAGKYLTPHYPTCGAWFPTCEVCGEVFAARGAVAKACPGECTRERRNRDNAEHYARNRDQRLDYFRAKRATAEAKDAATAYYLEHRVKARTCAWCRRDFETARARACSDYCKGKLASLAAGTLFAAPRRVHLIDCKRCGEGWTVHHTATRCDACRAIPYLEVRVFRCAWCECEAIGDQPTARYCGSECARRAGRARRRAAEHGALGSYTEAELMRVWLRFDRCCAYCEQVIDGRPEPDHVVPLSRRGPNSITNVLPSCSACNADKRDLLLTEWNADRARRGKPPRVTSWAMGDERVMHLTSHLGADMAGALG